MSSVDGFTNGDKLETVTVGTKKYYKINNRYFKTEKDANNYVINAMQGINGPYIGEVSNPMATPMPTTGGSNPTPPTSTGNPSNPNYSPYNPPTTSTGNPSNPNYVPYNAPASNPVLAGNTAVVVTGGSPYDPNGNGPSAPAPTPTSQVPAGSTLPGSDVLTREEIRDIIAWEVNARLNEQQRSRLTSGSVDMLVEMYYSQYQQGTTEDTIRKNITKQVEGMKGASSTYPDPATDPVVTSLPVGDAKGGGDGVPAAGGNAPAPVSSEATPAPTSYVDQTGFIKKVYKDFIGRDARQTEIDSWNDQLNGGTTQNGMLVQVVNSAEAIDFQNKTLASNGTAFDNTVEKLFADYVGTSPDPQSKRIYGAALKNGASIDDMRDMLKTSPTVQAHIASDAVTSQEIDSQNAEMASAVQSTDTTGSYGPTTFIKDVFKNYTGRDATATEIDEWGKKLANGSETKNSMLISVSHSNDAVNFQNAKLAGGNEFGDVVDKVFLDYAGVNADDTSKRIHGAALKNGMTIDQLRDMMKTSQFVQNHIAGDPVTDDELNAQNSAMANAVTTAASTGSYGPEPTTPPIMMTPPPPPESIPIPAPVVVTPPAPAAPSAPDPAPSPMPIAVAPPRVLTDNAKFVNEVYRSYLGREASDGEIAAGVGQLAGGKSLNQFQIDVVNSPESVAFQNKVMAGGDFEFDQVVDQVFQDYAGVNADDTSKRIHGAALKNGMSIDEFRDYMKQASVVQSHMASDAVTDDEINRQNTLMAQSVQAAHNAGQYKPVAVATFNPATGGFSNDSGVSSMPAAVTPPTTGIPGP